MGWPGIGAKNGAVDNIWTHLSTYDNDILGIDVAIPDDTQQNIPTPPIPVITEVVRISGAIIVRDVASPTLNSFFQTTVELYRVAADPMGFGEGRTFVGSTTTDSNGAWMISYKDVVGDYFAAFQTYHGLHNQKEAYATSGEYSESDIKTCGNFIVHRSFGPLVVAP